MIPGRLSGALSEKERLPANGRGFDFKKFLPLFPGNSAVFFFAKFRVSYINELSELRFGVRAASCRIPYDLMNRVLYDWLSRYQGQGIKAKDLRDFRTVSGLKFVGVCRVLQNTCKSGRKES